MKPDLYIRAAGSYDPETRTFTATFSAGSPRAMRDAAGPFMEIIDLSGFDPAALVGKPVFLDHRHTTDAAVGVVIDARREGGAIVGEVQLSAAESVADVRTKVAEGVIGAVSIGYHVRRWTEGRDASGRRTKTAAAGELVELSLVGLPADPAATIRSDGMEPTPETPEPQPVPAAAADHPRPCRADRQRRPRRRLRAARGSPLLPHVRGRALCGCPAVHGLWLCRVRGPDSLVALRRDGLRRHVARGRPASRLARHQRLLEPADRRGQPHAAGRL